MRPRNLTRAFLKPSHYFSVTTFTHHNLGTQKSLESPKRNTDSL